MVLGRVTCTSAADCWTVGYAGYGATNGSRRYAPLIEHWNGTRWSVVPSPGVGRLSGLRSISCASSVDCWAIGTWIRAHGAGGGTLTEHWNGSAWSRIPTPTGNSGTPTWAPDDLVPSLVGFGATMLDVSCVSGSACMAVGNGSYDGVPSLNPHGVENLGGSRALTERWHGTAWTEVSTPALAGANVTGLVGVSCTSGSWCMAVGFSAPRDGPARTLAEQWNGSAWTIVAVPNPPGRSGNELMGVSCVTSADCWALGSNVEGNLWFTAHWNGSRWSMAR